MTIYALVSSLCASVLTIAWLVPPGAAAQQKQSEPTGSVSGRITVMGKAVANIHVLLMTAQPSPEPSVVSSAKTDAEGQFTLSNLEAGRYILHPFAPAMVGPATNTGFTGKIITVGDGEAVHSINLDLSRGGVITGRVTDSNDRPVVGEHITLTRHEEGKKQEVHFRNYEVLRTDDRGQYRLYGLPPGRYSVSVGVATGDGMLRIGLGNTYYPRTFHPNVTDEAAAAIVEVKAGSETTGVDINLGRIEKTYSASGRITDAETGKPVANMPYGYGSLSEDGKRVAGYGSTSASSGPNGEFRIEGLTPERYAVIILPRESSKEQAGLYGEPTIVEIKDSDVSGIELRVRRGATVTGAVIIEGADEQTAAEKKAELRLGIYVRSEQATGPTNSVKVSPDGSFRATGLPPGKVNIFMGFPPVKGLTLLRTEVEGKEQHGDFDVVAGQQVSGVKVYMGYGTGRMRIQVRLEDGPLPEGASVGIFARRLVDQGPPLMKIRPELDVKGRYVYDGLVPGEYEVTADGRITSPGAPPLNVEPVAQKVTVTNGADTEITLVLKRK